MAEGTNWIMVDMSFDYQGSGSLEAKRNVLFVCLSMYVCMYVYCMHVQSIRCFKVLVGVVAS